MASRTVIAALVAAVALTVTPAHAAEREGCHPRAAKTAARNAKMRVFWVGDRLYACATGQRRAYELVDLVDRCPGGSSQGCGHVSAIRVASRYVATVQTYEGRDHGDSTVQVVDVGRREPVSDWVTPYDHLRYDHITDLELSPRGSLGLIARTDYAEPGRAVTYEPEPRAVLDERRDAPLGCPPLTALASPGMPEQPEQEPDLAARQREIAAAMDETLERQAEIRRRQDALLEQLGGIDRALDKRAGEEATPPEHPPPERPPDEAP